MSNLPRTPAFDLTGKRAFVPGGSRGIGLGCAVALAEMGADVLIAARSAEQVEDAAEKMRAEGFSASGMALDVSDHAALTAVFDENDFDVVCNSAGIARHGPSLDTTVEDFDAVMSINLRAAYFMSQMAAKKMWNKGGSIIHISSQMAHIGGIDRAVYCGSKHALEGFTKAMAIEWGKQNIRINTICPTFIRTPLTEPTFQNPERVEWIMDMIKLPRIGEVEDIMGAVQFLASPASAMVTGTHILVDGGWTAA